MAHKAQASHILAIIDVMMSDCCSSGKASTLVQAMILYIPTKYFQCLNFIDLHLCSTTNNNNNDYYYYTYYIFVFFH